MRTPKTVALLALFMIFSLAASAAAKNPVAISTPDAPAAIGPYSQAIKHGNLLFLSGQLPLDPATGKLVEGGITVQTTQVMKNLRAILEEAGLTFEDVLMTTVYLKNIGDFTGFNTEYATYFEGSDHPPARATIQAGDIPKGALLEVSMIAGR